MDVRNLYEKLFDKVTSPSSINPGKGAVYSFEKYCKHCNAGMSKPKEFDKKELKFLFSKGFCSKACMDLGEVRAPMFKHNAKSDYTPSKIMVQMTEEMALLSNKLDQELATDKGQYEIVKMADRMFRMLTEKLAYLESMTSKRWYPSKFYFWLNK